jgi:acetyltransferase-like isoleucine patch superfamily enzyme
MRKLQIHAYKGPENSLSDWWRVVNPFKVVYNFLLIYTCRILPSLSLKRVLYRLTGARLGKGVSVGLMAMLDIFWPELITIGENSIIGYNTTILCHEFLIKEWRTGEVRIGKNVMIGAQSLIMPGIVIGDSSTIAAYSLVNKDVPAGQTWGGVPAKRIG